MESGSADALEEVFLSENGQERDFLCEVQEDVRKEGGKLFNIYFDFLNNNCRKIVAFWFVVFIWGIVTGPDLLHMGDDTQKAPKGSRADTDLNRFTDLYTTKGEELPIIVLFQCQKESKCVNVDQPELTKFSTALNLEVERYNTTHRNVFYTMGYYQYNGTVLDDVKQSFISKDKQLAYTTVVVNGTIITSKRYEFVYWLNDRIKELNPDSRKYDIGLTGFDALAADGTDATKDEIGKVDSFSVPVALALLGYMVGSWRLLSIGLFNMGTSILASFAIMVALLKYGGLPRPESASAQLMQVMAMSLSIDYVLFLCRRFRDEIKSGSSTKTAVYRSLLYAGHVVIMSGITIVVVFLGFTFLPSRTVVMDGTSCSIGVTVTLLVALTNTPAMILSFPLFFSTFNGFCGKCASPYGVGTVRDNVQIEYARLDSPKVHNMYTGFRFKFTKLVTKWPYNVVSILILYILVIPLAIQCTRIDINEDIIASIPRGSDAGDRFKSMYAHFPAGTLSPFYIYFHPGDGKSVFNSNVFAKVGKLSERIQKETACKVDKNSVSSPAYLRGKRISFAEAEALLLAAKLPICNRNDISKEMLRLCSTPKEYEFLFQQAVNENQDAMLITILVPFFPFVTETQDFIDQVYDIVDEELDDLTLSKYRRDRNGLIWDEGVETNPGGPAIGFCGFAVGFDAQMRQVYGLFPVLIATTLSAVFIVLSIMLKSAFVPLRLALTLFLPLLAVYGLAVLVYQDGILNWLSASTSSIGGFYWYIPILITSMVCGLALDYDVFLISRIIEHRENGYDIRASIVKASCETGGTISAAGIIMTLAFGGMLLSNQSTMDVSGWLLATAVLLDTFVVNTILVPALMSLGDNIAWWPRKVPMNNLVTLEDSEFVGEKEFLHSSHANDGDTASSDELEAS